MSPAPSPAGHHLRGTPSPLLLAAPPEPLRTGMGGGLSHLLPAVGLLPLLALGGGHRSPVLLVTLLASSVGGALAVAALTRRQQRRAHRDLVTRWTAHRRDVAAHAELAAAAQRLELDRTHPADHAAHVAAGHAFERRGSDPSALHVCVATGSVEARLPVVRATVGPLQPVDPVLDAEADRLVAHTATLAAAPMVVALPAVGVLAVHGGRGQVRSLLRALAVQLAVEHSPGELELALVDDQFAAEVPVPHRVASIVDLTAVAAWMAGPRHDHRRAAVIADYDPLANPTHERTLVALVSAAGDTSKAPGHLAVAVVGCRSRAQLPAGAGAVLDLTSGTLSIAGAAPRALDGPEQTTVAAAQKLARVLTALAPHAAAADRASDLTTMLSTLALAPGQAPIGIGADGTPIVLDLREAAHGGHGPHGLIVGATGSGKSVLLRTLIVGLAAHNPPTGQQFLLIDFKGGAAFSELSALPHVVGLVTNLASEPGLPRRMVAAVEAELDRRQRVLAASGAPDAAAAGLPALLVAVDEATELLAAEPSVATLFAKVGRVGRSLGVHLLLATQRWEGGGLRAVDGHLRYRLCLRTLTVDDSRAVLGTDAAARLTSRPGAGYFAVDGVLTRVDVLALPADPMRLVERAARVTPIWLPPLPAVIAAGDLPVATAGVLTLGRVDRPETASQPLFAVDLDGPGGHIAVVGGPRSGVSSALATMVAAAAATESPDALHVHVLDLGGGCAGLAALPHVGTVAGRHQPELAAQVVAAVLRELDRRSAGLDSAPHRLLLVIDGVAQLRGLPDADNVLGALAVIGATGLAAHVHLVLGARRWGELRGGLADAVGTRVELRLADPSESLVGRVAASQLPTDVAGRGLIGGGAVVQIALTDLPGCAEAAAHRWPGRRVPRVRLLPTMVIEPDEAGDGAFALGVGGPDATPVALDLLVGGRHLLVTGDGDSGRSTVLRRLVRHLAALGPDRVALHLLDLRRGLLGVARLPAVVTFVHHQQSDALAALTLTLRSRLPSSDADLTGDDAISARAHPHIGASQSTRHVLVIDDADLIDLGPLASSPVARDLGELAGLLPYAAEVGLSLVLARSAGARAGDPLSQRLRAAAPWQLALPGEHLEGPAAGRGAPVGVGRGLLRHGGGPITPVQCYAERTDANTATGPATP